MTEPTSEFAQRLRALREAQGLSIRSLAARVGVSSVTIWKWEKGGSKPRTHLIQPLANALEVSPVALNPALGGGGKLGPAMLLDEPVAALQPSTERSSSPPDTSAGNPEALADVIAHAKQMIAEASGTGTGNITIIIEY